MGLHQRSILRLSAAPGDARIFKLIAEGTLEERIDAIIERKRRLMEGVVQEDDPTLSKIFTREELLELVAQI